MKTFVPTGKKQTDIACIVTEMIELITRTLARYRLSRKDLHGFAEFHKLHYDFFPNQLILYHIIVLPPEVDSTIYETPRLVLPALGLTSAQLFTTWIPAYSKTCLLTPIADENKIGTYSSFGIIFYIRWSANMSALASREDIDVSEEDLAKSLIAAYGGDAVAALRAVIEDAAFLHDELWTAATFLSHGITRGWQPRFQRQA